MLYANTHPHTYITTPQEPCEAQAAGDGRLTAHPPSEDGAA